MRYVGAVICLALLWIGAVVATVCFPYFVWFHSNRKEYARCIDQMVNAFLFGVS